MSITYWIIWFSVLLMYTYVYLTSITYLIAVVLLKRDFDKRPALGIPILNGSFFSIGASIGLLVFLYNGLEGILFFIPQNLGWYEEEFETFKSFRDILAWTLAFPLTLLVANIIMTSGKYGIHKDV